MKVCFFGIYDSSYARNRVLIKGFKENGFDIVQCRAEPRPGFVKYWKLFKMGWVLKKEDFDHVIVAFPGHSVSFVAFLIFGRGFIFDAFLSMYNSEIEERQRFRKTEIQAYYYYFLDLLSCHLAKKVLLDTDAHINYFIKKYKLPRDKFIRVYISTDDSVFYPRDDRGNRRTNFVVHFHGNFIPLHGVEHIVRAAKRLENVLDIKFRIVGGGAKQEYKKIRALAEKLSVNNIDFLAPVSYEEIAKLVNTSDICLGAFGDTIKSELVIPNKIFEGIGSKIPVLTGDTDAVHELFSDKKDIILCKLANHEALADAILELKGDVNLRNNIAQRGYKVFNDAIRPVHIVSGLLEELGKVA